MIDKALFIDTNGAKNSMHQLEIITNNLANVGTIGFRADYETSKPVTMNANAKNQSKFYSSMERTYSDFQPGPLISTERDLDIAMEGKGFIAVQSKSGEEAYTRAGHLQLQNGFLTAADGNLILGSGGVIRIPDQAERVVISHDGTISVKFDGQTDLVRVDRIKLTNPPVAQLNKGPDGLFYLPEGESVRLDENIRVTPGALEGSNVNAIKTLTDLIDLSRSFEFHTNLIKDFKDSASKANQILSLPR